MAVAMYANYLYVIRAEEQALQGRFAECYLRYCALVPRLLPRPLPPDRALLRQINPDPRAYSFSLALARRNKAFEAYLSFAGMVTGLLPIVGIPLPLMSYGGSSMVVSLTALGLLISIRMRQFH